MTSFETSAQIIACDDQYVAHTYGRSQLALVRGEGITAYDAEGKAYLDFGAGIGVTDLGYCHPAWVKAVTEQLNTLQHTSNLYYTAPCAALAEKLCTRTGMDKVFFGNSGAEANEGAIKAARKYSALKYGEGRSKVISLQNSFHGRTLATLTATGQDAFHHDFGPFPTDFAYVPANDFEAFAAAADEHTCAVLMELIQGEGGVKALDKEYVSKVVAFCREKDILVLVDEVQTGIGRSGTLFTFQQYGFTPDVVSMAKALGNGLPIGGFMMTQKVADGMGPGSHGSTFGGNPVAAAGACAVLDTMDEAFLENVRVRAASLRAKLAKLPHVQAVTGLGLMVGLVLDENISAAEVRKRCEPEGLLVLTAHSLLRLLPPLIITEADEDKAVAILNKVLAEIA